MGVFASLGENRREALKIAAGFRGEEAFERGMAEEQALETVLPWLSTERAKSSRASACSCTAGTGSETTTERAPGIPG